MPGFMSGIHAFLLLPNKAWMAGTSPAMTVDGLAARILFTFHRTHCAPRATKSWSRGVFV
jgi:hypothetical protein